MKILAPVDLRTDCEFAVNHSVEVAREFGAELFLLSATDTSGCRGPLLWPPGAFRKSLSDPDIHRLMVPGDVVDVVTSYADFIDADLVLAVTRRYASWSRLWGGSVAARLIERSARPFWLTTTSNLKPRKQFRCSSIVCHLPLDGSDSRVLEAAAGWAGSCGARLTLLHVLPPDDESLLAQGLRVRGDAPLSPEVAVARMAEVTRGLSYPHSALIQRGMLAQVLSAAVRARGADLAIAGRGPNACETRSVVSRLRCPVLSVPLSVPEPQTALQCAFSGTSRTREGLGLTVGRHAGPVL